MNSKITLPRLSALLALRSGKSKKLSEDFVKTFFSVIGDSLANGESVKVKGLGLFKIVNVEERKSVNVATGEEYIIPAHGKLTFLPAKELAETVNSPFSMFETVELNDAYTDEAASDPSDAATLDLQNPVPEETLPIESELQSPATEETTPNESELQTPAPEETTPNESELQDTAPEESTPNESELQDPAPEETVPELSASTESDIQPLAPQEAETHDSFPESPCSSEPEEPVPNLVESPVEEAPVYIAPDIPSRSRERHTFGKGFLIGFGTALLIILAAFGLGWYFLLSDAREAVATASVSETRTETNPSDADETHITPDEAVPTPPSDMEPATTDPTPIAREEIKEESADKKEEKGSAVAYDYVSTTRYLTTIAREHYGNDQFWPYIYEENKEILGHPNKIRPGTRVVVPPLSKYGVDPKNRADEKKARTKGAEIYSRYP